ncbi:MAG: 3-phosphoserine/phosphohydroxythreonine transaminase [Lachnospiraceae bacterium]|nr:3-phosphoserine/phosphohydroxythreonine transaminase [Lachnospiraceae bacterium]
MIDGRIYNFSAGPSILPESVLLRARDEFLNYQGSGMSVLEMSHRSKVYDDIICGAVETFRKVLGVPDNYKILFLHGGATGMFAALAMNLGNRTGAADYAVTGNFSGGAYKEGRKFLKDARIAATTEAEKFTRIPKQEELVLNPDADYLHVCWNNTIFGTTWKYIPKTGNVPLVADMSSSILSEPVDVSRYGMIYAGVQKNLAPAGVAVVIVREDLIGNAMAITPKIWNFAEEAKNNSMINTPATYPIYFIKLVSEWIRDEVGGLKAMKARNEEKAKILYDYLDSQSFYLAPVVKEDRSMMNVVFRTGDADLDKEFVELSVKNGFSNLKGHRVAGGMRASIYNAMPKEGVEALVAFMDKFASSHKRG